MGSVVAVTDGSHRSFLAFDYGTKRVGVATGNTLMETAQPLCTLASGPCLDAIERLVREWRPDALIVGVPFHPDGAAHANTRRARRFARELEARFRLPVHEVDERYTTTEAKTQQASDLDAAAAAIILEQFLRATSDGGDGVRAHSQGAAWDHDPDAASEGVDPAAADPAPKRAVS
jgi:putative Holliday junction resolvase